MARPGKHSWPQDSDVLSLFPTLAWKIRLRAVQREAIDASVLGLLQLLRRGSPELPEGEAWQSGHGLHRRQSVSDSLHIGIGGQPGADPCSRHVTLRWTALRSAPTPRTAWDSEPRRLERGRRPSALLSSHSGLMPASLALFEEAIK